MCDRCKNAGAVYESCERFFEQSVDDNADFTVLAGKASHTAEECRKILRRHKVPEEDIEQIVMLVSDHTHETAVAVIDSLLGDLVEAGIILPRGRKCIPPLALDFLRQLEEDDDSPFE